MNINDYYKILDIDESSSMHDIKRQYRKLVRKYHPDVNKSQSAIKHFNDIQEAYNALKSIKNNKNYGYIPELNDTSDNLEESLLENWQQHNNFEVNSQECDKIDDVNFLNSESNFQEQKNINGDNLHCRLNLTLEELYYSRERKFTLKIPSVNLKAKCKIIDVKLPKIITNSQVIKLEGQGIPGIGDGINGDLLIDVDIKQHELFKFRKNDIYLDVMLLPWEAALGSVIRVPTLGGMVSVQIPENVQSGQKLRLKGKGLPSKNIGDQILFLYIVVPKITNKEQQKLYHKMSELFHDNPRAKFK